MNWKPYADRLASEVTHAVSRWRPVVATVPRHVFVPRWWAWSASGAGFYADTWELREEPADPDGWLDTAYSDRSLITRVGPLHADYAAPGQRATGRPTSSATLPGLVVQTAAGDDPPTVHQSGPRRLWDILDDTRHAWLRDGSLPAYGAKVTITPDGSIHLKRGRWQAEIPASEGEAALRSGG